MSVLASKNFAQMVADHLQSSFMSQPGMQFGVIVLQRKGRQLPVPEAEIEALEPHMPIRQMHDPESGASVFVLEGQSLSGTHYFSIMLKNKLRQLGIDHGPIFVTRFSRDDDSVGQTVVSMMKQLELSSGMRSDIRIVNGPMQKTRSLLVVDNDATVGEFLSTRLGMKGYHVHVAHDGQQGLEMFERVSPEIVITELTLPIMDGYQLIGSISRKSRGKSKVMILTEKKLENDIRKCFELGASDFLTKPFSPLELEARIRRLLG